MPKKKHEENPWDKTLDKHLKHRFEWQPRYAYAIPPVLKRKHYREMIALIEEEIHIWTLDLVQALSEPECAAAMRDWAERLHRREQVPALRKQKK